MLFVAKNNIMDLYYMSHHLIEFGDLDEELCIILGTTYNDYVKTVLKFNAIAVNLCDLYDSHEYDLNGSYQKQYLFANKEDAIKCCKYCNEVYITLQTLAEFDFGEIDERKII